MQSKMSFFDKQIVILGIARQGLALSRFFLSRGAHVTVSDRATAAELGDRLAVWNGLAVEQVLGGHPLTLLDGCDLLCLSGGVPPQIPLVQKAIERGIPITNDALLTLQLARGQGLGPIVAITGSSGKTTTTTLVGEMLAENGRTVHVGGNIGTPLLDHMDSVNENEPIVLELSSFQLEILDEQIGYGSLDGIGPDVAVLLNVTPNHLDRHSDMAAYAAAKLNLLAYLPEGATVVLNADDAVSARLIPGRDEAELPPLPPAWSLEELIEQRGALVDVEHLTVRSFSLKHDSDAHLHRDELRCAGRFICRRDEVQLPGAHNLSNILAAACVANALGVDPGAIGRVARRFAGVAHRLEIVATGDGISWINDSIATSPERSVAALRVFEPGRQTLILLAGGRDKHLPWDTFADEVIERVNMLIGFGEAGPAIVNAVQERAQLGHRPAPNCAVVQRLEEAVDLSIRVADVDSVVLMSPGGTSFDAYPDFEARGEHFRRLIAAHAPGAASSKDCTTVYVGPGSGRDSS